MNLRRPKKQSTIFEEVGVYSTKILHILSVKFTSKTISRRLTQIYFDVTRCIKIPKLKLIASRGDGGFSQMGSGLLIELLSSYISD